MQIQVLYFAVLRERVGADRERLSLPDGATVDAAVDRLAELHETIGNLRGRFRTAVNQEMVDGSSVLHDGDELVLIPPVAGGQDRVARIVRDRAPSVDICTAAVASPDAGAVVTFTGLVRRHSRGRTVERLEYEAYDDMAAKVLRELCESIESEIPGARLAVEHRVGSLAVGELAVAIAAAAAHRDEAFRACRELIEGLKTAAPIWKKELGPDGAEWVGL